MSLQLLAALSWDPQIRGALIVVTAVLILPGSVYLLLATNTGAKLGFLIAAAGLTGWIAVMGWIWVVYGIGIKGDPPTWHAEEIVTGDLSERGTTEEAAGFPAGWQKLKAGDLILGDATASADKVLAPPQSTTAETEVPDVEPAFDKLTDYAQVGAYARGGDNCWLPHALCSETSKGSNGSNIFSKLVGRMKRGPFHEPHFAVVQVAPVIEQPSLGGAPAKPAPDPTKPVTNVVMVRDQGNLRFPSMMVALSMSIVFVLIASALHRRDTEIMAARARPAAARA
jgi:hypothetical protein